MTLKKSANKCANLAIRQNFIPRRNSRLALISALIFVSVLLLGIPNVIAQSSPAGLDVVVMLETSIRYQASNAIDNDLSLRLDAIEGLTDGLIRDALYYNPNQQHRLSVVTFDQNGPKEIVKLGDPNSTFGPYTPQADGSIQQAAFDQRKIFREQLTTIKNGNAQAEAANENAYEKAFDQVNCEFGSSGKTCNTSNTPVSGHEQIVIVVAAGVPQVANAADSTAKILKYFKDTMPNLHLYIVMLPNVNPNFNGTGSTWKNPTVGQNVFNLSSINGTKDNSNNLMQTLNSIVSEAAPHAANITNISHDIPLTNGSATFPMPAFVTVATLSVYGDSPVIDPKPAYSYSNNGVAVVTYENPQPGQKVNITGARAAHVVLRMGSGTLDVTNNKALRWLPQRMSYVIQDMFGQAMAYPSVNTTATITINNVPIQQKLNSTTGKFDFDYIPMDVGPYEVSAEANTGDESVKLVASKSSFSADDPPATLATVDSPMYVSEPLSVTFPPNTYPSGGLSQAPYNLQLCADFIPTNAPNKPSSVPFDDQKGVVSDDGITFKLSKDFFPSTEGQFNVAVNVRQKCEANSAPLTKNPLATKSFQSKQLYMDFLNSNNVTAVQFKPFTENVKFYYKDSNGKATDLTTEDVTQIPPIAFSGTNARFDRTNDGFQASFPALKKQGTVSLEISGDSGILWGNGTSSTSVTVTPVGLDIALIESTQKQFNSTTVRITLANGTNLNARQVSNLGVVAKARFIVDGVDDKLLPPFDLPVTTDDSAWELAVPFLLDGTTRLEVDLYETSDLGASINTKTSDKTITVAPINFIAAPLPPQPIYAPTILKLTAQDTQADIAGLVNRYGLKVCAEIAGGNTSTLIQLQGKGSEFVSSQADFDPKTAGNYTVAFSLRPGCTAEQPKKALSVPSPLTFTAANVYIGIVGKGDALVSPALHQNLDEALRLGWFYDLGGKPTLYKGALDLTKPLSYSYTLNGKKFSGTLSSTGDVINIPASPTTELFRLSVTAAGDQPITFYPGLKDVTEDGIPVTIVPLYLGIISSDPNQPVPLSNPTLAQFNSGTFEVGYFYIQGDLVERPKKAFSSVPNVALGGTDAAHAHLASIESSQNYRLTFDAPMSANPISLQLNGNIPNTTTTIPLWMDSIAVDNTFQVIVNPAKVDHLTLSDNPVQFGNATMTVDLTSGSKSTADIVSPDSGVKASALIKLPDEATPIEVPLSITANKQLAPTGALPLPLGGTYGIQIQLKSSKDNTILLTSDLNGGYTVKPLDLVTVGALDSVEVEQPQNFTLEWRQRDDGTFVSPTQFANPPTVQYQILDSNKQPVANSDSLQANADGKYTFQWQPKTADSYDFVVTWDAPSFNGQRYPHPLPSQPVIVGVITRIKLLLNDNLPVSAQNVSQQRYYDQLLPFFLNFVPLLDPGVRRGTNFSFDIVLAEDTNRDGKISNDETTKQNFTTVYGSKKPEEVFNLVVTDQNGTILKSDVYHAEYLPTADNNNYSVNISGLPQNEDFTFTLVPNSKEVRGKDNYRIDDTHLPAALTSILVQSSWMFLLPIIIYGGILIALTAWIVLSANHINRMQSADPHLQGYLRLEDEAENLLDWEQDLTVRNRNTVVYRRERKWSLLGVSRVKVKHMDGTEEAVEATLWHDNPNILKRIQNVLTGIVKEGLRALTPYRLNELWAGEPEVVQIVRGNRGERLTYQGNVVGYLKYSDKTHEQDS